MMHTLAKCWPNKADIVCQTLQDIEYGKMCIKTDCQTKSVFLLQKLIYCMYMNK